MHKILSSLLVTIPLVLAGVVFVLALPLMPVGPVLLTLIGLRSLTDIGAASAGSLLPSSTLSAVIGGAAIAASLIPHPAKLPRRMPLILALVYLGILVGALVPMYNFGTDPDLLKEPLRLASIIAVFVLAFRYGCQRNQLQAFGMLALAAIPAIILAISYILQLPFTISGDSRAAGTFSHPNSAAAFFCFAGVLSFSLWWFHRKVGAAISAILCITATLMTGSLGGLASLVVGVLAVITVSSRLKPLQKGLLFTVLMIVAVVSYNLLNGSGRLAEFESFDASSALQTGTSGDSLEWRVLNWHLLLPYWQAQPWLGQGLGTTYTYIMPLGGPPHSLFVQLLVETGIVGSVWACALLIVSLKPLTRKLKLGYWEASVVVGLLSVALVNGSESNLLGYTAAMYLFAFYTGALSASLVRRTPSDKDHEIAHLLKTTTSEPKGDA